MKNYQIRLLTVSLLLVVNSSIHAQEDLLKLVGDDKPKKEIVKNAFKSPRIINGQSIEFLRPGTMDFRILHRFGQLDQGYKNLFGLDEASMRIGFDFGIMKNLMVGFGRSTYRKELDAYFKYAPFLQSTGQGAFPFTIAVVSGMTMDGMPWADPERKNYFTSRLGYFFQVLLGRMMTEKLTLQLSPTMVHQNLVKLNADSNNIFALGIGGRFRLSRRISLTWDYYHVYNPLKEQNFQDPLSVGVDIETGGHVFQLHFSNSTGMNERAFITETTGKWDKLQVRFGFNLSRVFQLKKKKLK
jgi:hypothetical protein